MTNPWALENLDPDRAVLLRLSIDPQKPSAIANDVRLSEGDVLAALRRLTDTSLAIREGDEYELTGPLSWFGNFQAALAHHSRKNFLVTVPNEPQSHLYICDIRIKGARPVGDPLTETSSVLGCGKTARDVAPATGPAGSRPTCPDCDSASRSAAKMLE